MSTPDQAPLLTFVPYDRRFLDCSFQWFQDGELRRLTNTPVVTRQQQETWFDSLPTRSDYQIWGVEFERRPIGACGIKHIAGTDAEYWGYIGDSTYWGRGLGRQMVGFCLEKAAEQGLARVWLTVDKDNQRAIGLYRNIGFKETGQANAMLRMELDLEEGGWVLGRLVNLPKVADPRGNLTFIEGGRHIPFPIARVFYLYEVPGGADRGGHALKTCHQLLIAVSGSFDVILDNGNVKRRVHLCRSYYGLHIPPLVWREMDNFSSGSVCLVLASEQYDSASYYRDYPAYLQIVARQPGAGRRT